MLHDKPRPIHELASQGPRSVGIMEIMVSLNGLLSLSIVLLMDLVMLVTAWFVEFVLFVTK